MAKFSLRWEVNAGRFDGVKASAPEAVSSLGF
jgi:hypothetical protein